MLVWPDKVKQGFVTDVPCVTSDHLPTLVDVLGIGKHRTPNRLDGISLMPLLEGHMNERPVPIESCFLNQVSFTDNNYKLYTRNGKFELYDMIKDHV